MTRQLILILFMFFLATPVLAQGLDQNNSDEPIEVTADKELEWQRDKQIYIARGNATVIQGNVRLDGQVITAHYREDGGGATDIWQIIAKQDVVLTSEGQKAHGSHLIYNVESGIGTLTGEGLKIITENEVVTAEDKIEYFDDGQKLIATGNARAVSGKDAIDGDVLTAYFKTGADGKTVIDRMEAEGNVILTTPEDIVEGRRAVYTAGTNKARILGGVVINRGPNVLHGEWAEVDLDTGISQLFAPKGEDGKPGRVRGVFYPESQNKDDDGS